MNFNNPIDEANWLQSKLQREKQRGKTKGHMTALANKLKIPKSSLSRKLKLLDLDDDVQYLIASNLLQPSFAETLFQVKPSKRHDFAKKIINEGMSIRRAKKLVLETTSEMAPGKLTDHAVNVSVDSKRLIEEWEQVYGILIKFHTDSNASCFEIQTWDDAFIKDLLLLPDLWASDKRFVVDTPSDKSGRNPFSLSIYNAGLSDDSVLNDIDSLFSRYQKLMAMRTKAKQTNR
jgi:hypothetical protein